MRYDPLIHGNVPDHMKYVAPSGIHMINVIIRECRMGFGRALIFDSSGENNITRGIKPVCKCEIHFDKNQQPKFIATRNHPRVLQAPYVFHLYGANNDTQYLLVNDLGNELFEEIGPERYQNFFKNLLCMKMGGLEHYNGVFILELYVTGYTCKGNEMSKSWEAILRAITKEYCSRDSNKDKNLKSLVAKHMNEIAGSMSIPRDQAAYLLSGGIMKRNSFGTPLKCSVSSIDLESFGSSSDNSFQ